MTISGDGGVRVDGPKCRPSRFGLKSVAEVESRSDDEWSKGLEWDQLPCGYDPGVVSGQCPPLPEQRKTAARGFDSLNADAFAVYAGWECSAGAGGADRAWDNADYLLMSNWWRTLERILWTGLDQDGNVIRETLATSGPTDVTPPAGAVDISSGLALLESFYGDCSDCEPVVHANRGLGVFMGERGLLEQDGDQRRITGTGSLVSVSGGYLSSGPGGVPADEGEAWMYISGGIKITQGPRFFTPDKDDLAGSVNRLTNDMTVFAERIVAIQIGCCVGAVRVALKSCCC